MFDRDWLTGVVAVLLPGQRLIIEMDGFRAHSSWEAFVHDRWRQNRLLCAGYLVLRFASWDVIQRPDAVLEEIREAPPWGGTRTGQPLARGEEAQRRAR